MQLQVKYIIKKSLEEIFIGIEMDTGKCKWVYTVNLKQCYTFCYSCEDVNLSVTANILRHRIACFGYVITEGPLPGK